MALQQTLGETKRFMGKKAFQQEKTITDPVVKATEKQPGVGRLNK